VDGAKGIEPQTRKLFAVARMRNLPIFTFVNKVSACATRCCAALRLRLHALEWGNALSTSD
jgi:peptide subunit release factor RF-3